MSNPIREITLERFVLEELDSSTADRLRGTAAATPGLAARIQQMRSSNADILSDHPASVMGASIRRRLRESRPSSSTSVAWAHRAILAGALATLAAFAMRSGPTLPPLASSEERVKGISKASTLRAFRKTPTGSEPLAPGTSAARGDLIRLGYETTARRHGVIVSIDGRGVVTRHWPIDAEMAAPLKTGSLVLLDRAFELDDAPRFERFYLVTSDRPFALKVVESALATGSLETDSWAITSAGLEWTSLELRKEASR